MRDTTVQKRKAAASDAVSDPAYQAGGGAIRALLLFVPIVATLVFGGVDWWMLGFLSMVTAVLAAIWLAGAAKGGEFRINTDLIQIPLIGLFVIGLIQLLPLGGGEVAAGALSVDANPALSFDPYATRLFLVRLAVCAVFFAAALTFVDTNRRITAFAVALLIFGPSMSFFAILQRLASAEAIYGMRPTPQAIPFGPFVNQHHFAALMEMLSGLALGLLFGGGVTRDKKILVAMGVVVMTVAVVFTGSRGGLISFVTVVVVAAAGSFLYRRGKPGPAGETHANAGQIAVAVGAVAALLAVAVGTTVYLDSGAGLMRGVGAGVSGDFSTGRTHFWSIALKIFLDHPVIGAGLDAFGVAYTRYDTWNGMFRVEQAHNDYLQTLADSGILGFACVVGFIVLFFRRAAAGIAGSSDPLMRSIAVGAAAGCTGILIHSFFDFPLRTPANGFVFLLLAVLAVNAGRVATGEGSKRSEPPV